jgi:creatinine amidohydrolase
MRARLALNTWREVEAYLARSRLILVPIGSTEQHGPNGILGTDYVVAEAVAVGAGERAGALVAPTIAVGMAMHHMAFPGSMTLRPETLMAVLRDTVWSLHAHGFRGVLFVNGHGGNVATATAAFSALREELPDVVLEWVDWYKVGPVRELAAELYGDREGGHATPSEVAVTMALYPEAVRPIAGPLDMESCRPRGIPGSAEFRRAYPDGRVGSDPSLATAAHGQALLDRAIAAVADQATHLAARVAPTG